MVKALYQAKWQPDPQGGRLLCGSCGARIPFTRVLRNEGGRFERLTCNVVGFCVNRACKSVNDCDAAFERHLRSADCELQGRGVA